MGAPVLTELSEDLSDPIDIAISELEEGVLPMTIRRTLPNGAHQDIALSHLLKSKHA